ncbi:class I SAM-dependent methyltransferase [Roseibium sp. CAU 1637]|uniref:Class I SAM-dependent methyltransferase n=1 Tax=Roseibium limicola TaxID=2816037 RepID=A0A939J591_9HYPH|nr:class I SAM-dependent methyltransferase [Roseibium limicola]MBO0343837.1 class I SAM-dependent methyltransferase [Roseibium limicola]
MTDTPLKKRLKARLKAHGPMTVADYMATCLADPADGYYMTRPPFGRDGDFITAPEVSQMFGELIGAFLLSAWEAMGSPTSFQLVELGPGRGTLMADVLRTARLRPAFMAAANLCLVETSEELRQTQRQTLADAARSPTHYDTLEALPDGPLLLVANEFFDALPIHQFIKTPDGWRERLVGLNDKDELSFGAGTSTLDQNFLPPMLRTCPLGTIVETQPSANAIAQSIGERISLYGGTALLIDYGYLRTAPGDTLQALHKHQFDDIFARPGEADLTAHVNFEALQHAATVGGAHAQLPLEQGEFLLRLGLLERAGALGANLPLEEQDAIRDAVERLAAPEQMGRLFKVLAISQTATRLDPF